MGNGVIVPIILFVALVITTIWLGNIGLAEVAKRDNK